jgi:hypothetical protein
MIRAESTLKRLLADRRSRSTTAGDQRDAALCELRMTVIDSTPAPETGSSPSARQPVPRPKVVSSLATYRNAPSLLSAVANLTDTYAVPNGEVCSPGHDTVIGNITLEPRTLLSRRDNSGICRR